MREFIKNFGPVTISSKRGMREVNFENLQDEEFVDWDATDEELILTDLDSNRVKLKYKHTDFILFGRNPSDDTGVEIRPLANSRNRFKSNFEVRRETGVWEESEEVSKTSDFAVVSKVPFQGIDRFKPEQDSVKQLDDLFDKGYEKIVYTDIADSSKVSEALADSEEFEITFYVQGPRRWNLFVIKKQGWRKMLHRKPNQNLFKMIQENLSRNKATYGYINGQDYQRKKSV